MSWIKITGNGNTSITKEFGSAQSTVSVLAPAAMGGTVGIGYVDEAGTFNLMTDGALVAGGQAYVRAGASLPLVINVTGFTAGFSVFVSLSRD